MYPFVFDDMTYIINNPLVKCFDYYDDILSIFKFAQLDEKFGINQDVITNFAMRPITYLTFSLNYLVGGFNPAAFRMFNILVHIFNSIIVYFIIEKLLVQKASAQYQVDQLSLRLIPSATALFFLIHPLQTESVIYINQRFTSLATSFYTLSVLLYICYVQSKNESTALKFKICSVLVLAVGMFTKEIMFTAPVILLSMELVVFGTGLISACKRIFFHLLCMPIIPIMVILVESAQSNSSTSVKDGLNIVNYANYSAIDYAITQLCAITSYLRLIILPYGQNVDIDYPLYTSLFQGRVILSMAVICAILFLTIKLFRHFHRKLQASLVMFGVIWFFVTISPDSSIIPLPDLMVERRTYLASIGVFLALVSMLDLLRDQSYFKVSYKVIVTVVVIWGAVLSGLTYKRSNVWRTRVALWEDSVAKSPNKIRPIQELAKAYTDSGEYELALNCVKRKYDIYKSKAGNH